MSKNTTTQLEFDFSANTNAFASALKRMTAQSESWAKNTMTKVNTVGSSFVAMGDKAASSFANFSSKASKSMDGLAAKSRTSLNEVGTSLISLGTEGAGKLADIYLDAAQSIDQLAKTSDSLGMTTEALGGLRFAAEQTGVSQDALDASMQQMNSSLSQAAQGGGDAVGAIQQLGLDAAQLASASPEKAFGMISDAMGGVTNQSEKSRIAMSIFGSQATGLTSTLALGSEGLGEMASQAEELGVTISRFDAAKIEQANNSTSKAKALFSGFAQQMAVKFAPVIQALVGWFTKAMKNAGGMGNVITSVMNVATKVVGFFADGIHGIVIIFKTVKTIGFALGAALTSVFSSLVNAVINVGQTLVNMLVTPIRKVLELAAPFSDTANSMLGDLNNMQDSFNKGGDEVKQFFSDVATSSKDALAESAADLQNTLMKPLPSQQVKDFVDEAVRVSDEGAAKIAANSPGEQVRTGIEAGAKVLTDKMKSQFDSVSSFMMSSEDKVIAAYEQRRQIVNDYFDNVELPDKEKRNEILNGLDQKREDELRKIKEKSATWGAKFEAANFKGRVAMLGEAGSKLMSVSQGQSKKAFKIGKALALAQAAVALPTAVMESFKNGGGFPWGLIPAGIMLGKGLANIKKIKSAKFNGGSSSGSGGAAVGGGGGGVGSIPQIKSGNVQTQLPTVEDQKASQIQPIQNTYVIKNPQGNDGRKLAEEIRTFVQDGGEIIPASSRQHEQLQGVG